VSQRLSEETREARLALRLSNQNGGDRSKDPIMDVDPPTEATDLTEGATTKKVVDDWSPSTEKLLLFFL
jgi:hypothetical protein